MPKKDDEDRDFGNTFDKFIMKEDMHKMGFPNFKYLDPEVNGPPVKD